VSPPVTLTEQGAKQSVTGVATDNAGNTASISCVVNIDLTPPEAYLQFDVASKDLDVYGTDALSGVPPGPVVPLSVQPITGNDGGPGTTEELRIYKVLDLDGNSLVLNVKVYKNQPLFGWYLLSLQYQSSQALTPPANSSKIAYLFSNAGVLQGLEQNMSVGSGNGAQTVAAQYQSGANATFIQVGAEKPMEKPGLDLLRLATQAGKLVIQY